MVLIAHGKRAVGTVVIALTVLGVANMAYYTEHMLPALSPLIASVSLESKTVEHVSSDKQQQEDEPLFPVSFNDKTIPLPDWSAALPIHPDQPAQILLTNYGWNHPNQTFGLSFARSIRQTQLLQGIVQHPWFHPIDWDEVSARPTNITTYVFLDVEMCFESNWPNYGGVGGYTDFKGGLNVDVVHNRSQELVRGGPCCSIQNDVLAQPIFQSPNTRLVMFDCSGHGLAYCCLKQRNVNKTTVVSISASSQQHSDHDLGLPPPAGKLIHLTPQQIHDIETCNETSRLLLYTFAGAFGRGKVRSVLKPLHNGKDVLIVGNTKDVNMTYDDFLLKSKFTGTPMGDNLFSYRFTEAMSAGGIPVVHADHWVLPFSSRLINWNKCAVIIPQARANETIEILSRISAQQRCEMRKCVLEAYQRFMSTPERTIDGIVQSLQLQNGGETLNGSQFQKTLDLLNQHKKDRITSDCQSGDTIEGAK